MGSLEDMLRERHEAGDERVLTTDEITVAAFVRRFYKPDRLRRYEGQEAAVVAGMERDLAAFGSTLVSRHASLTGDAVWLIGSVEGEGGDFDPAAMQ